MPAKKCGPPNAVRKTPACSDDAVDAFRDPVMQAASTTGNVSSLRTALTEAQAALRQNEAAETATQRALKEAKAAEKKAKSDAACAEAKIKKLQTEWVLKKAAVGKARKALDEFLQQNKPDLSKEGELSAAAPKMCAFHPVHYSSGELEYNEDDPGGGLEIQLEARVQMQAYELRKEGQNGGKEILQLAQPLPNDAAAAFTCDDEGGAAARKKRRTSKTSSKPLLSSAAQFHKLRQEVQRSGECVPAAPDKVKLAVLKSLNFGDKACLHKILMGSYDYELLSNAAPRDDAPGLQGNLDWESEPLQCLKKKLTRTLGLPEKAADFVARQEARGCAELIVWLLGDKKKATGNKIHGTSRRKVLIYGVGPSAGPSATSSSSSSSSSNIIESRNTQHIGAVTEVLLVETTFVFRGELTCDGLSDFDSSDS